MRSASFTSDPLAARDERGGELDLSAIGRALWRKKLRIILPALVALIGAIFLVQAITPKFKSTASILLQSRESAFTRPVGDQISSDQQTIDEQAVASQVQLLRSRDLARNVIKALGIEGNPEFDPIAHSVGPLQRVLMVLGLADTGALEKSGNQRVLEAFDEALTIYPMTKSRVIAVEFDSRDPELAAKVANGLADAYIAMQGALKRGDSLGASEALSTQIADLRLKVAKAEQDVETFRSANGLFLSQNNATLTTQQLSEFNAQLSAALALQAEAQAKANLIRNLLDTGRPLEVSEITNNELIRRLVEQRVNLGAQLALELRTLLPGHPRIKELNAQLADLQSQIVGEARRTVRSLENDARISGARVKSLADQLDLQKAELAASNEQEVKLRALEREAKSQRDLLESYLSRFRDASSRASLQELPADARIVSRASAATTPFFPKKTPIILIATLIALVGSIAFIVTGELLSGRAYLPVPAQQATSAARVATVAPERATIETASAQYDPAVHHRLSLILRGAAAPETFSPKDLPPIEPAPARRPVTGRQTSAGTEDDAGSTTASPVGAAMDQPPEEAAPAGPATAPALTSSASAAAEEHLIAAEEHAAASTLVASSWDARDCGVATTPPIHPGDDPDTTGSDIGPDAGRAGAAGSLAALLEGLRGPAEAARTILFSGPGSDAEISQTASACARALAEGALRVILIAGRTGLEGERGEAHGLGDLLAGEASFLEVIHRDRYSRLHLITAGCPIDHLDAKAVAERTMVVFDALSSTYDAIVFDVGSLAGLIERPDWAAFLARCETCALVVPDGIEDEEARQVLADWGARKILAVTPENKLSLAAA